MSLYYECTSLSVVAQLLHSDSSLRSPQVLIMRHDLDLCWS